MADLEQATAQNSGVQDSAVAVETPPTSQEFDPVAVRTRIDELTGIIDGSQGDIEAMRKAEAELSAIEEDLQRRAKGESAPATTSEDSTGDTSASEAKPEDQGAVTSQSADDAAAVQAKKFFTHWQGKRVEVDDPNNLLGFGTTGDLKAGYLKQKLQTEEAMRKSEELTQRLLEAERKSKEVPAPQVQATKQPEQPAPVAAPSTVAKPVAPKPPKVSTSNPLDYTDADEAEMLRYQEELAVFNERLVDYTSMIESRLSQPTVPQGIVKELEDLRKWKQETNAVMEEVRAERERVVSEKADFEYWKRFSEFQDTHKSFTTPVPLNKLNDKMVGWMDELAVANGAQKPSTPRSENDPAWQNYLAQRLSTVSRYMDNDPAVVSNAQGINPPRGHDKYLEILSLENARMKYVADGILGPNATLEDAYTRSLMDSGEFGERLETLRTKERSKAVDEFGKVLEDHQNHATTIAPEASAAGPDLNNLGVSQPDMQWFLAQTGPKLHELRYKDPQAHAKWLAIADIIERSVAKK